MLYENNDIKNNSRNVMSCMIKRFRLLVAIIFLPHICTFKDLVIIDETNNQKY